jgi:hypothetical protein
MPFSTTAKEVTRGQSYTIHFRGVSDFPGETFRVLKEKEDREFGE